MLTEDSSAPPAFSPHLILISERLRPEAGATVEYFRREGVALKVISGHRPDTVASIKPAAGIPAGTPSDGRSAAR
ncbi:MAG TPA: hypothetical protein VFL41_06290 [Gaiellaceae bacterium]|nr:hypothetical protein [Gaiellaceae bacterium]